MGNNRSGRINEEVMKALADLIRNVKDPRLSKGLVSIVHVDVTGDLSFAKVYISVLGADSAEVLAGLKSASGFLRTELAHKVQLRHAPELIFIADDSIQHGAHINEVLSKLGE